MLRSNEGCEEIAAISCINLRRMWLPNYQEHAGKGTDSRCRHDVRGAVRLSIPGKKSRVSLPLEFCVKDNGPGVPEDLMPNLFDPFVTTKPTGSGLGLALVAKIVGDHGGIIECESVPRKTTFRVLLPMFSVSKTSGEVSDGEASTPPRDNAQAMP